MSFSIPSAEQVRQLLVPLRRAELMALSSRSGVPFTTAWKVRSGETRNPGIETCRQLVHNLAAPALPADQPQEARDAA